MRAALINTGTELLLGDVQDAHLAFIAREIFPLGLRILERRTVPDTDAIRRTLTEDEMVAILTETKNAMVKQYTKLFSMEGVRLTVTKDALRALAAQAVTKGTGARALRSMLERIMLDIMYDVPSREDIAEVTINRAVVEGKKLPLIRKKQDKTAA